MYWKPDNFLRQIYLIPKDAFFIIETDNPVNNWNKFSKSQPWQHIKSQEKMKEIGDMANTLDSILNENETLLSLLGKRNLMISAHMTRKSDYDFLYVVDLQKASKMESLKDQMEIIFKSGDYKVTSRKYQDVKIMELFDPIERTTLYMSFIDNHLICSFTGLLVEKSIQEKEEPKIGRNLYFLDIEQKTTGSGLFKIYVNYQYLNNYLTYLSGVYDKDMASICKSLSYTGLVFDASDKKLSLKGYTNLNDSIEDGYLPALMQSGRNKITAQKVLSSRTAFFLDMGFEDANKFMDNVENILQEDPQLYKEFRKNWDMIESLLKIDIRKNFLSWMEGEVALAQNTQGMLGRQNEFVVVIKMKNKKDAIENLDFIEGQIRKRTPVKFKTIEYEGYGVHYIEMKGFFKLLFGKMFEKLDKPYYTIIDDYAVFSNSPATLLSQIEDYRIGQILEKDSDFSHFFKEFNDKSSVFAYTNTRKFFPLMKEFVSSSTWKDLQTDQNFILGFPQTAFQLTGEKGMFDTRWIAQFSKPEELKENDIPEPDEDDDDFVAREDTLSNLEIFYFEKMQKNVYTEFYDDGTVKSKSEVSKGLKNGKYIALYPDGKQQVTGKFKENKKDGTWKFYNENGKQIRKEKWKNGVFIK